MDEDIRHFSTPVARYTIQFTVCYSFSPSSPAHDQMDKDTSHNEVTVALSTSTIFESLDTNSQCLLKTLLFFNPDSISLTLFNASDRRTLSIELGFRSNESR